MSAEKVAVRGGSRHSKSKCYGQSEQAKDADLYISKSDLRDESEDLAWMSEAPIVTAEGAKVRREAAQESFNPNKEAYAPKSALEVLNEWRDWMDGYEGAYFEYSKGDKTVKADMVNSYHSEYQEKRYAQLKGLERRLEAEWLSEGSQMTTVMLTLSASNRRREVRRDDRREDLTTALDDVGENQGVIAEEWGDVEDEIDRSRPRAPGDHMRDIQEGWDTARAQLSKILSGYKSCKIRIWEPHKSGYGHQHIAIFIEGGTDLQREDFAPFMESFVRNCAPAGQEAHRAEGTPCADHDRARTGCSDCKNPVSINQVGEDEGEIGNMGSYVLEYVAANDEDWKDESLTEQMFNAVTWASSTRRFSPDSTARDLMRRDRYEQDTGLNPQDHEAHYEAWKSVAPGGAGREEQMSESDSEASESGDSRSEGDGEGEEQGGGASEGARDGSDVWTLDAIGRDVEDGEDERYPPPDGGGANGNMVTITDAPDHEPVEMGGWDDDDDEE